MKTLATPLLLSLLLLGVAGCKSTGDEAKLAEAGEQHELSWLFVQTATSGSFDGKTLTLNQVPATLAFTDRPDRITGHLKNEYLVAAWDQGDDSFEVDPPNAVLSTFGEHAQPSLATVALSEPKLEDENLTYSVEVLEGDVPATFDEASLFIDNSHWLGGYLLGAASHGGYGGGYGYGEPSVDPGPQANNPPVAHGDSSYLTYYTHQSELQQQQRQKAQQDRPAPQARKKPPTVEQKLEKLKQLHDQGLITDQEYEKRQAQLLDQAMAAQP